MNYFGVFFCFTIPGIIIGLLLASSFLSAHGRRSGRSGKKA